MDSNRNSEVDSEQEDLEQEPRSFHEVLTDCFSTMVSPYLNHIKEQANEKLENYSNTLADKKQFESKEIELMKKWKLSEISYEYPERDDEDHIGKFKIINNSSKEYIWFSNRTSTTANELRGDLLRAALDDHKSNNEETSLYDAITGTIIKQDAPLGYMINSFFSGSEFQNYGHGNENRKKVVNSINDNVKKAFSNLTNACINYLKEQQNEGRSEAAIINEIESFVKNNYKKIIESSFSISDNDLNKADLNTDEIINKIKNSFDEKALSSENLLEHLNNDRNKIKENIQNVENWIKEVKELAEKQSGSNRERLNIVAKNADKALTEYKNSGKVEQKTGKKFIDSVESARKTQGLGKVSIWKNILSICSVFGIAYNIYNKVKGRPFWIEKTIEKSKEKEISEKLDEAKKIEFGNR